MLTWFPALNPLIQALLAITLHNIPEGLAVGVAFGAVAAGLPGASLAGALALAIGIGIQNLPEGTSVSVPLRREGLSRRRAWAQIGVMPGFTVMMTLDVALG